MGGLLTNRWGKHGNILARQPWRLGLCLFMFLPGQHLWALCMLVQEIQQPARRGSRSGCSKEVPVALVVQCYPLRPAVACGVEVVALLPGWLVHLGLDRMVAQDRNGWRSFPGDLLVRSTACQTVA